MHLFIHCSSKMINVGAVLKIAVPAYLCFVQVDPEAACDAGITQPPGAREVARNIPGDFG